MHGSADALNRPHPALTPDILPHVPNSSNNWKSNKIRSVRGLPICVVYLLVLKTLATYLLGLVVFVDLRPLSSRLLSLT